MIIVFVVHNLSTGTLRYTEDLVRGLAARGHRCTVVNLGGRLPLATDAPFEVISLESRLSSIERTAAGRLLSQVLEALLLPTKLRRILRRKNAQFVYSQNLDAMSLISCLAAWKLKMRVVVFVHDLTERELALYEGGFPRFIMPILMAFVLLRQKAISFFHPGAIAASSFVAKHYEASISLPVEVIPLGVSPQWRGPTTRHGGAGLRILCVGKLEQKKRFDVPIRAISMLKARATLTVVGSGPLQVELRALTSSLGVAERVEFTGYLPDGQLRRKMEEADVAVVPSLWEGFGYVPLEAMAMGLPVIASRAGALPELVKDGVNGYLFPVGDYATLAKLLDNLAGDGRKVDLLRAGALETAARLRADLMVGETESFLRRVATSD